MDKEQFELLKQELCSRLPCGVKIRIAIPFLEESDYPIDVLSEIDTKKCTINNSSSILIENVKPYLRPMSSMTEKEKKEFDDFCVIDEFVWKGNYEIGYKNQAIIMSDAIDWLNEHHIDYRGLIEKGLVLEAPEDMYKF